MAVAVAFEKMEKKLLQRILYFGVLITSLLLAFVLSSDSRADLSNGQTVYVPVYSHVYVGERGHSFNLAVTLTIRNIDPRNRITVVSVDYHDSDGKLVKSHLERPLPLEPLASTAFFVKESDVSGGMAPNFIVRWQSEQAVNEPIIEGVMIGARSGQGISFVTNAKVIQDRAKLP